VTSKPKSERLDSRRAATSASRLGGRVEQEEAVAVLVGEGVLEVAFARDELALKEAGL
jgi:hypothetical protein